MRLLSIRAEWGDREAKRHVPSAAKQLQRKSLYRCLVVVPRIGNLVDPPPHLLRRGRLVYTTQEELD